MGYSRFDTAYQFGQQHTLQYLRHFSQILAFVFLNAKIFGLMGTAIIVPYLHVTEAPFSTAHGAYESLEFTIARGAFPLLVLGVIYLTATTVGRVFCGWACPFGLVQDVLAYLPFKKQRLTNNTAQQLKDLKWVVLGLSLFSAILVGWRRAGSSMEENPMGVFSDSPFSVFSPAGTLFAYLPWMLMWNSNVLAVAGLIAWVKIGILIATLVPSLYIPRFFCRYVCPMGALLEPATPLKSLRINKSPKLSVEHLNNVLADVCPMAVQMDKDSNADYIDSPSCVHCGKCVTELPKQLEPRLF